MQREEILNSLHLLNKKLLERDSRGEICLYGGAVMCLVFDARPSTKDVDAVFHPSPLIRELAKEIATEKGLEEDWLNDGVKGFLVEHQRRVHISLSNLTILVADAEYLLAMKALASRIDGTDRGDVEFLIRKLGISSAEDAIRLVEKYYPKQLIKPATKFFLEELFDGMQDS